MSSSPQVVMTLSQEEDGKPPPPPPLIQQSTMADDNDENNEEQAQRPTTTITMIDLTESADEDEEADRVQTWLSSNQHMFRAQVAGPLKDCLCYKTSLAPAMLQELCGRSVWNHFVVQTTHDADLLRTAARKELGIPKLQIA